MGSCRGGGGKRLRMSPSDGEGSPRRPRRSSRRRTPSAYSLSPSPYRSPSPLPSPSTYRSPSPSPCRSWSQRLPSGVEEDADDRSRSRGSDEIDACGRPLWRPNGYKGAGEQGHGDVFSVHIDGFDYDRLFTCKCCRRMLSSPVFQCPFGHLTCSRCDGEFRDNRCGSCGAADGYGRNRAVEEFLARICFSCRNKEHGCTALLVHHEMPAHEESCLYEPCFCPIPRCGFAGRSYALKAHLIGRHHWRTVNFRYGESFHAHARESTIMHSKDDGELFFLDSFREGRGTALSMICIRPDNAVTQEFAYELKTPIGNGKRRHKLQMQSTARNTSLRNGMGDKEKVFLLVPNDMPCTEDGYVEVCIRKDAAGGTP
ncbi:E3 ubiquitin-protein ligase SINA-like 2 [Lolium perenne]|uniref:E3 ubiquitin-protein ligase SINA-like 2 n=1 Tax=Lolium perenne TaxID=4522 RepID=UPI0021EAFEA4|nr:E3 ubiquitin-protein ligase SINA-like 2 [Lolium perenne]XP_051219950.1 E3 ubiquitin-protein ligase SINA-like 2 [Lolium perenne]